MLFILFIMWKLVIIIIVVVAICCYFLIPYTEYDINPLKQLYEIGGCVGGGEDNRFKFTDTWKELEHNAQKYCDLIYTQERMVKYDVNWSAVFQDLQNEINEPDVEYAGLINLDSNNKAIVMNKFKGKYGSNNPDLYVAEISHHLSLSTIVLNSRDWSEIVWLPEISRFKINLAIGFIRKKTHWNALVRL